MYEEDNRGRNTALAVIGTLLVVALVAIFFLKARKPDSVPAPTVFQPYTSSDKTFVARVPDGWKRVGSGGMGLMSGVTLTKSSASISVMSDLMGSLMGDMAQASNNSAQQLASDIAANAPPGTQLPPLPPPKPPVEQVHQQDKGRIAKEYDDFSEEPMHEFHSPLGDARVSEWTGTEAGPFGSKNKVHGYRATILGGERRFAVVCKCADGDWPHMKPAFQTVIGSLASGGG